MLPQTTWHWVLADIIRYSRISEDIERVNKLRRVRFWASPYSGHAVLSTGLAALTIWETAVPGIVGKSLAFRVAITVSAGGMADMMLFNMVQAVFAGTRREVLSANVLEESVAKRLYLLAPTWIAIVLTVASAALPSTSSDKHADWWPVWLATGVHWVLFFFLLCCNSKTLQRADVEQPCWLWAMLRELFFTIWEHIFILLFVSIFALTTFVLRLVFDMLKRVGTLAHHVCTCSCWMRGSSITMCPLTGLQHIIYWCMCAALRATDFFLAMVCVETFRLTPLVDSYHGSLAWQLSMRSINVVQKPMAELIVDVANNLPLPQSSYQYLREGAPGSFDRVARVGQIALVMLNDTKNKIMCLSCEIEGNRAIVN